MINKLVVGFSIFLVVILICLQWILPAYARNKIVDELKTGCPSCKFSVGSMGVDYLKWQLTFRKIGFESDPSDSVPIKFVIEKVVLETTPTVFKSDVKPISKLVIDGLQIWITEFHNGNPRPPNPEELKKIEKTYGGQIFEALPPARIESIEIKNSDFHYTMKIFGKDANLSVHHIDAAISALGTRRDLGPRFTEVNLTGQVQETGKMKLKVKADLFSVKNEDEVHLWVDDQKLSELNTFFTVEDGIEMQGYLNSADVDMFLRQGHLTGQVKVDYRNFALKFISTPNQGGFSAWIGQNTAALKFAAKKPAIGKPSPMAKIKYDRKPEQSIINLLLQGMKDAALKAALN